jgi:hypothetical protein
MAVLPEHEWPLIIYRHAYSDRTERAKMDPSTGQLTDTLCAIDETLRHFLGDLLVKAIGTFVDHYRPNGDCGWLEENFITPEILAISTKLNNMTK